MFEVPPSMSVYPSAGDFAAISEPIVPPEPPRLSTMICCPHASLIFWPIDRANISPELPGVYGTMKRIGFVG
jgi:hypothetical protein